MHNEKSIPVAAQAQLEKGCTRSHPHENMSPECEALTEAARVANQAAQAQPLPDSLIPTAPDLEYLRDAAENTALPAFLRGQIVAAVTVLQQPVSGADEMVSMGGTAPAMPRWLIDAADRITAYMAQHHGGGDWAIGGIQSRGYSAQHQPSGNDAQAEPEGDIVDSQWRILAAAEAYATAAQDGLSARKMALRELLLRVQTELNYVWSIAKDDVQAQQDGDMVSCGCGDLYPATSYGAGFIAAAGHCENCDAAEPAPGADRLSFETGSNIVIDIRNAHTLADFVHKGGDLAPIDALHQAITRLGDAAQLQDADKADAERYRTLVASGNFVPAIFSPGCLWGLRTAGRHATKAELDAAIDAARKE